MDQNDLIHKQLFWKKKRWQDMHIDMLFCRLPIYVVAIFSTFETQMATFVTKQAVF